MSLKDFEILKLLGKGSFSEVFKVKRISDGQEYAMKKVKLYKLGKKEQENALNEIRILASVDHKNVIGYKEAFFDEDSNMLCIVMENADGGDLEAKIQQAKSLKSFVKEEKIWYIFKQTIEGLKALHNQKIVHRDIKCANIFLGSDGSVKLGDMNVSKIAKYGIMQTQTGTPYYCPPEVWQDKPYSSKCDIWSLGCVIYELTSLKPPFLGKNMNELFSKVTKGHYPDIPSHFSRELSKMISLCLNTNPTLRPSAEELLQQPAFQDPKLDYKQKVKMQHRRASSMAQNSFDQDDKRKNDLLKTIKLPKNFKQLNKGLLPKKNYDDFSDNGGNTLYSQQENKKSPRKNSIESELKNAKKINYESDAAAGQVSKLKRDQEAKIARAEKFRKRYDSSQKKDIIENSPRIQQLIIQNDPLNQDDENNDQEPQKCIINEKIPGKDKNRNDHSIKSTKDRKGNLLPEISYNEVKLYKKQDKPPNIPQTPVKSQRIRQSKAHQVEESKNGQLPHYQDFDNQIHLLNQIHAQQNLQQRPLFDNSNQLSYRDAVEISNQIVIQNAGYEQQNRNGRNIQKRANSYNDYQRDEVNQIIQTVEKKIKQNLKLRIAEHSPAQIRNAAGLEAAYLQKKIINIDSSNLRNAIQKQEDSNLNYLHQIQLSARQKIQQAVPRTQRYNSHDRQEQQSIIQNKNEGVLMELYPKALNSIEKAQQIINSNGNQNILKPPMSSRHANRGVQNGNHQNNKPAYQRPPSGRIMNGVMQSPSQANLEYPTNPNQLQKNYNLQRFNLQTPQTSSTSSIKPPWWG